MEPIARKELKTLSHAVQYRGLVVNDRQVMPAAWHTLAAFDVKAVADKYARDAEASAPKGMFEYRVVEIAGAK